MRRQERQAPRILGLCLAGAPLFGGCQSIVTDNIVSGLRDGTLSAAEAVVNGFFETRFDLSSDAGTGTGPVGADQNQEGGNDLFTRL